MCVCVCVCVCESNRKTQHTNRNTHTHTHTHTLKMTHMCIRETDTHHKTTSVVECTTNHKLCFSIISSTSVDVVKSGPALLGGRT